MASQASRMESKLYTSHLMNSSTTPTITTKSTLPINDQDGYTRSYFKEPIPSSSLFSSTPLFTSTHPRIVSSKDIGNNINDNTIETYTKRTIHSNELGSRLSPIITNRQSNEYMMKSTESSSPIVDYLLYDAPAWMRQSKIKNHKVISSVNSSSTISSNIITTTTTTATAAAAAAAAAAATAARTPVMTTISPSSNITHIVNDTKPNTDNITIIHKENVKNMNSGSRITIQSDLKMNPKLNPPSYMQKLDDVLVENDWTIHDGSRRFTPILSSPISIKTPPPPPPPSQFQSQSQLRPLSPPLPPIPPTTIPLIEKINQLTTINKFNEIIQPNYKENLFTEQKSIWNKANKPLTQFNEQLPPNYSNKLNHQRIIHSTPCSPTIERNILIKPIHNHEDDDDVLLRNHKKSSIGLPPRPLRSPIIRLNGRSMSPIHSRISPLSSCINNEVTKTKQIDPITGEIQYITSRTRSYTDLNTNQLITEIEENIQGEGDTE
ncbi:uncharacterized protein DC041_0011273, partial [Schistosoma bovis]